MRVNVRTKGWTAGVGLNFAARSGVSVSFDDGRPIPENGWVTTETEGLSSHVFDGRFFYVSYYCSLI